MECIGLLCTLMGCSHTPDDDFTGPLGIDYHCLYDLHSHSHDSTDIHSTSALWHTLLALLLLTAVIFWIRLISHTASTFFSPTLQRLGSEAHLSDHFAGKD
jgi:hypothetical protein